MHRVNNVDVPEPPIEDDDQVPLDAMFESTNMLSDDPTVLPPDGGNMEEDSSGKGSYQPMKGINYSLFQVYHLLLQMAKMMHAPILVSLI